jgi:ABC-2 type transport system ATP-binding protein
VTDLVIETRGLRKEFGSKTAVEDLSLSVRRGEVFGFLGSEWRGEDDLDQDAPGARRAHVGIGIRPRARRLGNREVRARLGFLPEHFRFQDWLTGRELLHFHGSLLGTASRRRAGTLGDPPRARRPASTPAHRPIRTYSKG